MRQLNIKNEETYRLAQELSRLTGENVTQAVTRAVEERLERLRAKAKDGREGICRKAACDWQGMRGVADPRWSSAR